MGWFSRLFGRVQEEPLARPEPAPPPPEPEPEPEPAAVAEPGPEPEPAAAAEPQPEPELEPAAVEELEPDVGAGLVSRAAEEGAPSPAREGARPASPIAEPGPEPDPRPGPEADAGPPTELSLTLDEVTVALRGAGSDGIRIGFLSREYLRAAEEERAGARRRLVGVLTDQLRARGLLAEGGTFELREEQTVV